MKLRQLLALALGLPALLFVTGCDQASNADLDALQGTWTGTQKGEDGLCKAVISGKSIRFEGPQKPAWYEARITLKPGSPKKLQATVTDSSVEKYKGKTLGFIYKIDGQTLTFARLPAGQSGYPSGFDDAKAQVFALSQEFAN